MSVSISVCRSVSQPLTHPPPIYLSRSFHFYLYTYLLAYLSLFVIFFYEHTPLQFLFSSVKYLLAQNIFSSMEILSYNHRKLKAVINIHIPHPMLMDTSLLDLSLRTNSPLQLSSHFVDCMSSGFFLAYHGFRRKFQKWDSQQS